MSEDSVVSRDAKASQVVWQDPRQQEEMSKAVTRMGRDNTEKVLGEGKVKDRKVFLVSGLGDLTALTSKLEGADMRDSGEYDSLVTHILINKVFRSEKLLCCTAAGKWVLHPQYIIDSEKVCL